MGHCRQSSGVPVYKLLGGKIRDKVRVYNGSVRFEMKGVSPEDHAADMEKMKALREGFTIIKQGIAFHSPMPQAVPGFSYGEIREGVITNRGSLTERGLKHTIACVEADERGTGG